MEQIVYKPVGELALMVEFENKISLETNQKVRTLQAALEHQKLTGVGELIATYRSLLIHYDPLRISYGRLKDEVRKAAENLKVEENISTLVTEIPICYEDEFGVDMEEICALEGKTREEIIRIHSQNDYFVFMLGFSPGHPFASRLKEPFSFGRRASPRVKIAAGSIVVQLGQSDIIPFDQPCGWNIIGMTPVLAYDKRKDNPFLLHSGQWFRHVPINRKEFHRIRELVERGEYTCHCYNKEGSL